LLENIAANKTQLCHIFLEKGAFVASFFVNLHLLYKNNTLYEKNCFDTYRPWVWPDGSPGSAGWHGRLPDAQD
jgi:hypothetical protein